MPDTSFEITDSVDVSPLSRDVYILCFLFPIAGLVLYLLVRDTKPASTRNLMYATGLGILFAPISIMILVRVTGIA